MGFRTIYTCDAPGCTERFETTLHKLSKMREELKKHGWQCSKSGGSCFCPRHLENAATGLTQSKVEAEMKREMFENTFSVNQYDAARIIGVTPSFLQRRRFLGQTPPFLRVGNQVRYRVKDLQEFLIENRVAPVNL